MSSSGVQQPLTGLIAGSGSIIVSSHGAKAVFSELSSTYPLKLLSPRVVEDGVAVVYVMSYGGGLVGGDKIVLTVDVLSRANLVLLSQGSTKVFKTRFGKRLAASTGANDAVDSSNEGYSVPTAQTMKFAVSSDSALFLLPDPVTCFRDATYHQIQIFELSSDASVMLLDWITSGRKSLNEEWVFSRYYSVNEIFVNKKRIAKDVLLLENFTTDVKFSRWTLADRLAPYSCYAMLMLYGPKLQDTIKALRAKYDQVTVFRTQTPEDIIWSLSPMVADDSGAVVRIAGKETETVRNWLGQALGGVENIMGVDVYRRAFL